MSQEEIRAIIKPSKFSNKKRFSPYLYLLGALLILALPAYSLRKYAEVLVLTPPAEPQAHGDCGVVLTGAAGRIREGIALLSHKQVEKLVISGVHQRSTLAEMFPEILFYPEINLENVILERTSSSTAGNAQQSLPIVETLHCRSILLVTSDYHMFRALRTFNQIFPGGIKIIPYPIPSDRLQRRPQRFFDSRFWGTVFEEWSKFLFYEVFVF